MSTKRIALQVSSAPGKVTAEGADHSFKAGKQDTMSLLVKATSDWVEKILK